MNQAGHENPCRAAISLRKTNQRTGLSVLSLPMSLSPSLWTTLPGRGQPEVEGGHPEEHGDWPGCGDAQPDPAPGQPRVH